MRSNFTDYYFLQSGLFELRRMVSLGKCTCTLITTVASLAVFVSLLNFFSLPLLRSSFNGSLGKIHDMFFKNLGFDFSQEGLFLHSSRGSVVYRSAPWKADIGRWLSKCDSASMEIEIVERIGNMDCKNSCNGQGVCNKELRHCRCFHGYAGLYKHDLLPYDYEESEGCSEKVVFNCNFPATPNEPFGGGVTSRCGAYCDTTRAMCFCGAGTKYPNRPAAEWCGFEIVHSSNAGESSYTNYSKADHENIFTTDSSKEGWCNVDPEEAYANKVNYKKECHCPYDCQVGRFCETPTVCSCINQCSLHGHCRGGSCQCENGWYGIDCSVPSCETPIRDWPRWIQPSKLKVSNKENMSTSVNINAVMKRKRPLIYIYDLPPEFGSQLIEGRHIKDICISRLYDENNRTTWTGSYYAGQVSIYESLLSSPHRTLNGEEADYFYVPVLDMCIIPRAGDAPHMTVQGGIRSLLTLEIKKRAYDHIVNQYTYWNRSFGRDHIWYFSWDEGACYAPKEIWNSTMVVHWGNTNSKHNSSTTAYWQDYWAGIPTEKRGDHPCFDPSKDLVIPSWKVPDPVALSSRLLYRTRTERKIFFYFNGDLGSDYNGRPEAQYSMRIRQRVAEEFGSVPNKEGKLGRQHQEDVIVTHNRSPDYQADLANSTFCGVFPGDGWSARMEDSVLHGCIPVIIQDGIFLPYENVLDFENFAIRILEDDIPKMIEILKRIDGAKIESMMNNVRSIASRFRYRDSVLLEAERQKVLFGDEKPEWAVEYSKLEGDDVFSTFIQILHYKLYNDPWRRDTAEKQESSGLPKGCLK